MHARCLVLRSLLLAPPPARGGRRGDPHLDVVAAHRRRRRRGSRRSPRPPTDFAAPEPFEARPGGAATPARAGDANAFSHPSANIDFERELDFKVGNGLFRKLWVTAPVLDRGLRRARAALQRPRLPVLPPQGRPRRIRRPGRTTRRSGMFLRLSVPAEPARPAGRRSPRSRTISRTLPEPTYGGQLQTFGDRRASRPRAAWRSTTTRSR